MPKPVKPALKTAAARKPRPVTGGTPAAERQLKSLAELRKSGGDKVCSRLPAKTLDSLKLLQAKLGVKNRSEAIIAAIDALAAKVLK
jgi:hypothetical protein